MLLLLFFNFVKKADILIVLGPFGPRQDIKNMPSSYPHLQPNTHTETNPEYYLLKLYTERRWSWTVEVLIKTPLLAQYSTSTTGLHYTCTSNYTDKPMTHDNHYNHNSASFIFHMNVLKYTGTHSE